MELLLFRVYTHMHVHVYAHNDSSEQLRQQTAGEGGGLCNLLGRGGVYPHTHRLVSISYLITDWRVSTCACVCACV